MCVCIFSTSCQISKLQWNDKIAKLKRYDKKRFTCRGAKSAKAIRRILTHWPTVPRGDLRQKVISLFREAASYGLREYNERAKRIVECFWQSVCRTGFRRQLSSGGALWRLRRYLTVRGRRRVPFHLWDIQRVTPSIVACSCSSRSRRGMQHHNTSEETAARCGATRVIRPKGQLTLWERDNFSNNAKHNNSYNTIQGNPKKRIPSFIFGITSVIQHRF